jgi:hypothetical protein
MLKKTLVALLALGLPLFGCAGSRGLRRSGSAPTDLVGGHWQLDLATAKFGNPRSGVGAGLEVFANTVYVFFSGQRWESWFVNRADGRREFMDGGNYKIQKSPRGVQLQFASDSGAAGLNWTVPIRFDSQNQYTLYGTDRSDCLGYRRVASTIVVAGSSLIPSYAARGGRDVNDDRPVENDSPYASIHDGLIEQQ